MSREAMKQALEALEDANDVARMEFSDEDYYSEAINALRLADQLEQAAAELRRLHALNQELLEACKAPLSDDEFIGMVDSTGIVIDPDLAFEIKEMVERAHGIGVKA